MNETVLKNRIQYLTETIEEQLPELFEMADSNADVVILHQDAFAADYQNQEYNLLGMAIKYLGMKGKKIHIIGNNRETLEPKKEEDVQS